jgi:RimJ/RimL family protein N-acetyltransferase
MMTKTNLHGQPVGKDLPDWTPRPRPSRTVLEGRFCRLEPLDPDRHAAELYAANGEAADERNWTYFVYGPFPSIESYTAWMRQVFAGPDPHFYAIRRNSDGLAAGIAAYLRIDPAVGSIEVGHLNFSPRLQRTPASTEALYLLMANAFETLGYRRYEWKCDTLNAPSRAAAQRLGFTYEGLFRQATVYKGRNRDTAWFSILDSEWPALKQALLAWLDPENFDEAGRQKRRLEEFR